MLQDLHLRFQGIWIWMTCSLNTVFVLIRHCQRRTRKPYKAGDGWARKRHTVPGVQLEVCPIGLSGEFAPDSEKSRRNQIWFCESHRHTEQRNKTILLKSSQYSKKIGAPVEINLDIVAEETSPNHYIKSGNIPLALLLEGSFHSMFENRVLPLTKQRLSP
jgi:hypothetical protein